MVLTGNSMGIAVKFGINSTLVVLEMVNFQYNTHNTHGYLSQISLLPMLLLVQIHESILGKILSMFGSGLLFSDKLSLVPLSCTKCTLCTDIVST